MANAVIARQQGDDFQARFFWLQATRVILEDHVREVGYEVEGVRAFDDVSLHYDPPQIDGMDRVYADYFQVKYHVTCNGEITAAALTEPEFIGATKVSLLQRLRDAQQKHCPGGSGVRFHLVIQWPVSSRDILADLVSNDDGRLRLDRLFDGRPSTRMAKLRKSWIKHLELSTEDELAAVLRPLRIWRDAPSLGNLRHQLTTQLMLAGWAPYSEQRLANSYDQLPRLLLQRGLNRFDSDLLRQIGQQENLRLGPARTPNTSFRTVGIRSFSRAAENLHETVDEHLCLLDMFEGRSPRADVTWQATVAPAITRFLHNLSSDGRPLQLTVSAHASISFLTGYHFDGKRGIEVYPVQAGRGTEIWRPSLTDRGAAEHWSAESTDLGEGPDTAIALGVTHDVGADVRKYVTQHLPQVGRILTLRAAPIPSPAAVRDGTQAHAMAVAATAMIRTDRKSGGCLHLFYAGPNALWFFMGQQARVLGRCTLYEYDFGHQQSGPAYSPSFTLPSDESSPALSAA